MPSDDAATARLPADLLRTLGDAFIVDCGPGLWTYAPLFLFVPVFVLDVLVRLPTFTKLVCPYTTRRYSLERSIPISLPIHLLKPTTTPRLRRSTSQTTAHHAPTHHPPALLRLPHTPPQNNSNIHRRLLQSIHPHRLPHLPHTNPDLHNAIGILSVPYLLSAKLLLPSSHAAGSTRTPGAIPAFNIHLRRPWYSESRPCKRIPPREWQRIPPSKWQRERDVPSACVVDGIFHFHDCDIEDFPCAVRGSDFQC